jgi:hypothetical protein
VINSLLLDIPGSRTPLCDGDVDVGADFPDCSICFSADCKRPGVRRFHARNTCHNSGRDAFNSGIVSRAHSGTLGDFSSSSWEAGL